MFVSTVLAAAPTVPEGTTEAQFNHYQDQGISVWAPSASVQLQPGAWQLGASWNADFISGATPVLVADTISSATRFEEARNGANLDARYRLAPAWTLGGSLSGSTESDHHSLLTGSSLETELPGQLTRLRLAGSFAWVQDSIRGNSSFAETSYDGGLELGWNQIWGRSTASALLLGGIWSDCGARIGCQANPYRYVPAGKLALWERHPDQRGRLSLALSLSQAIGPHLALHGGYSAYLDSWEVSGHTGRLMLAWATFGERLQLRLQGRLAWQSPASFYQDDYSGTPAYRTADRELAGFWERGLGLQLRWSGVAGMLSHISLQAQLQRLWFLYPHYSELPRRDAWVYGGGVHVAF